MVYLLYTSSIKENSTSSREKIKPNKKRKIFKEENKPDFIQRILDCSHEKMLATLSEYKRSIQVQDLTNNQCNNKQLLKDLVVDIEDLEKKINLKIK